jgi:hypothetical protein
MPPLTSLPLLHACHFSFLGANMSKYCPAIVLYCAVIVSSLGCATVISGRHAEIAVRSNPPNAQVAVRNEKGETVATSATPGTVLLKRSNGLFKKAPRYTAHIEKPGYETAQVSINPKWNPWILGNIAIGGVIGLAADSATGAIWRYSPDEIDRSLSPISSEYYSDATQAPVTVASMEIATATDISSPKK